LTPRASPGRMRPLLLAAVALALPGCVGGEPWLDVWVGYVGDMLPYERIPIRLKTLGFETRDGGSVDVAGDWTVDLAEDGSKVAWRGERPEGRFVAVNALTAPDTLTLRGGRTAEVVVSDLSNAWDGRGDPWLGVTLHRRPDGRYEYRNAEA
jgi:hypothetical protein